MAATRALPAVRKQRGLCGGSGRGAAAPAAHVPVRHLFVRAQDARLPLLRRRHPPAAAPPGRGLARVELDVDERAVARLLEGILPGVVAALDLRAEWRWVEE